MLIVFTGNSRKGNRLTHFSTKPNHKPYLVEEVGQTVLDASSSGHFSLPIEVVNLISLCCDHGFDHASGRLENTKGFLFSLGITHYFQTCEN